MLQSEAAFCIEDSLPLVGSGAHRSRVRSPADNLRNRVFRVQQTVLEEQEGLEGLVWRRGNSLLAGPARREGPSDLHAATARWNPGARWHIPK